MIGHDKRYILEQGVYTSIAESYKQSVVITKVCLMNHMRRLIHWTYYMYNEPRGLSYIINLILTMLKYFYINHGEPNDFFLN